MSKLKVECQNCSWKGTEDKCKPAKDVECRHELGDIFSDIECPKCGALCYPVNPKETSPGRDYQGELKAAVATLERFVASVGSHWNTESKAGTAIFVAAERIIAKYKKGGVK